MEQGKRAVDEDRARVPPLFSSRALTRVVFRQREFWWVGLACFALLTIVTGRIQEHRDIARSRERVAKAVLALQSTENVTTLLLNAETSQRGFLLTGADSYLQPYERALHEMPAALSDLEAASRAMGGDQSLPRTLEKLAHAKLSETSETIRIYRRAGATKALSLVHTNAGQQMMEQIWQKSKALKQGYIQVFTRESERLELNNRHALRILAAGSTFVVFILLFSTVRLKQLFGTNQKTLEELQLGHERYRQLAQRLEAVREEERAHLAREIHDELGQTLTTIKLGIATAVRLTGTDPAKLSTRLEETVALTDRSIRSLRRIAGELRPPLLDAVGLAMALRVYTGELQERTGLTILFIEETTIPPLSPEQRIAAYRICQECLTNVLRHSGASQATVCLSTQEAYVELQVKDNGRGFVPQEAASRRSLGLLGMEERAELVDGQLLIVSYPGTGTAVTLRLPVLQRAASTCSSHLSAGQYRDHPSASR